MSISALYRVQKKEEAGKAGEEERRGMKQIWLRGELSP